MGTGTPAQTPTSPTGSFDAEGGSDTHDDGYGMAVAASHGDPGHALMPLSQDEVINGLDGGSGDPEGDAGNDATKTKKEKSNDKAMAAEAVVAVGEGAAEAEEEDGAVEAAVKTVDETTIETKLTTTDGVRSKTIAIAITITPRIASPASRPSPTQRRTAKREPMPTPSRKKHESDSPRS